MLEINPSLSAHAPKVHKIVSSLISDAALDRLVAVIGADRVLAAIDRATQPQLPLQAAE